MDLDRLPVKDAVADYQKLHRIGEGTYGVVYKAKDLRTGEIVALKRVRFDRARDGLPVTALRELRVLQQCRHDNLVALKKVVTGEKAESVFLVFEFCQHDLGRLMDCMPKPFSIAEVKCLIIQLLLAVGHLHSRWIVHRDLKLSNLLYTSAGILKLCDFGLARYFQPHASAMTPSVVTLWYRPPELLLGCAAYSQAVDLWGVGCIAGELLNHAPLFPGHSELECLHHMCRLLGTPTPRIWPGMATLPNAVKVRLPDQPLNHLRMRFPALSDKGIDFLDHLLTYDPDKRMSAQKALKHAFLKEKPYPKRPIDMPTFPSTHESPHKNTLYERKREHLHKDVKVPSKRSRYQTDIDRRFGEAFS